MIIMSLLLSAGLAGAVAIGVTVAIERWGGQVGGLLGTLPTTIVPAAAGIAAQGDVEVLRAALFVTPAGMLLNATFLYLWRVAPPHLPRARLGVRLGLMIALSLGAWFALAVGVVLGSGALQRAGVPLLAVGVGLTFAMAAFGVGACLRAPPAPRGHRRVGPVVLLSRGLVAALAIGTAVWLSAHGSAVAAGVAAVFPAIFVTTMTSLWLAQGEAVPAGAVGPMMLGSTSVAAYALLAAFALPALGLVVGSAVAWVLASGAVTVPAWAWLKSRGST